MTVKFGSLLVLTLALAQAATAAEQTTFSSPLDGFTALAAAVNGGDEGALKALLGPDSEAIVSSGDAVEDRNTRAEFMAAYKAKNSIDWLDETHAVLVLGEQSWEFPIPLEKQGSVWRFDTATGKQELLNRRIGRNETAAIQASLAYVDAQRDFARRNRAKGPIPTYAQRIVSNPGAQDGLYWPVQSGESESPLGPLFASAQARGYVIPKASMTRNGAKPRSPTPYYGYVYRILTAQGPAAKGGALNYLVNGKMVGGFALVASPAVYRASGVMTFIVNHEGKVYQKDLGPRTERFAQEMIAFNPDKSWKAAQ